MSFQSKCYTERITSFLLFVSKKIKTVQTIVALQIERNTQ